MRQSITSMIKQTTLFRLFRHLQRQKERRKVARKYWQWSKDEERRRIFYEMFFGRGDLVFDVGANLGNRTRVFFELGATVVAIEPQTRCADFLEAVFCGRKRFHLVREALGRSVGQLDMFISEADTISSLSEDWIRAVKNSGRFARHEWNMRETVSVTTLDRLVERYGSPKFIKIDVEGYEDQVLSGLSKPVPAISFEFTPEFLDSTRQCIEHLSRIGNWRFQLSLYESMEFALPNWVAREEIEAMLVEVPPSAFGDLYAMLD